MIVVKVELWSAITHEKTEIARMIIANIGTSGTKRNYKGKTLRGRSKQAFDKGILSGKPVREGFVEGHRSEALHVWYLVAKMLTKMGYK